MPVVTSKAIVLQTIKYSDNSLIVKSYTKKEGLKSYLIKGVLKAKKGKIKPAYFQQLTQLQIVANHKVKTNLHSLKEVSVSYQYQTIYKSIVKQSIVIFIAEVLSYAIQEEEENETLFSYIESSLIWLDSHERISNFHLLFLLNLTRFLGFYPDISEQEKLSFSLLDGKFTDITHGTLTVSGSELTAFKKLLGIDFEAIENVSFNKSERQAILQMIIRYFELHLSGFRAPKSLPILEAVFS